MTPNVRACFLDIPSGVHEVGGALYEVRHEAQRPSGWPAVTVRAVSAGTSVLRLGEDGRAVLRAIRHGSVVGPSKPHKDKEATQ